MSTLPVMLQMVICIIDHHSNQHTFCLEVIQIVYQSAYTSEKPKLDQVRSKYCIDICRY